MVPELRPYWLAERAAQWSYVISRASDSSRFGEPDVLREIESHLFGAHMCVLALSHLHRCIGHLRSLGIDFSPDLRTAIDAFTDQYESAHIKDARDALEHEEDRVAGLNLHGRPAYGGEYPDPRITGSTAKARRMTMIRVLDEDFELSGVITAALALEEPLRELEKRLWPA